MKRAVPRTAFCVLIACALTSPLARGGELCGHGPLQILLTNDDGYEAPGIRALYGALKAAGHAVTLVAPETDMSGSSSSLSRSDVTVRNDPEDAHVYAVGATPATTVLLAVNAPLLPARPDLVISGINNGANTGAALPFSGTVGAVIAGAVLLDPPVPGIAVSAARGEPSTDAPVGAGDARARAIARRFAQLLDSLRPVFCARDVVATGVRALNVNFPAADVADVKGVRATVADAHTDFAVAFNPSGEGRYRMAASDAARDAGASDTDVAWLARGYVTVTALSGTYSLASPLEPATRALIDSNSTAGDAANDWAGSETMHGWTDSPRRPPTRQRK